MISTKDQLTVTVFGKTGCQKCAMLNRRLDKLLTEPQYAGFKKVNYDVLTEDGLMRFCKAECLNPSRVPAMIISKTGDDGQLHYVENPDPEAKDDVCKRSKLYQYLGIQTDYSADGKGVITPEMIQAVLDEALRLA